jgi:hypothetical protein
MNRFHSPIGITFLPRKVCLPNFPIHLPRMYVVYDLVIDWRRPLRATPRPTKRAMMFNTHANILLSLLVLARYLLHYLQSITDKTSDEFDRYAEGTYHRATFALIQG